MKLNFEFGSMARRNLKYFFLGFLPGGYVYHQEDLDVYFPAEVLG